MNALIVVAAQYLIVAMALAAVVCWALAPAPARRSMAIVAIVSGVLALVLTKVAGAMYYDPRPFLDPHIRPLFDHSPDNGFPSDHTVIATLIGLTVFRRSRRLGLALLGLAIVVGCARVAAHVHHALDIAAGVGVAGLAFLAARPIARLVLRAREPRLGLGEGPARH